MNSETNSTFDYKLAFSRNIGWLTPDQQTYLSTKRIAIPGIGGVGGHHLDNFLRIGFKKFNLADPDIFEIQNFNRQVGATMPNIGRYKVDVAHDHCMAINPESELNLFYEGVHDSNYEKFLENVDIVVDALDLYAMEERIKLYALCEKKGIPVITAAPLGMGTSLMAFHPDKMGFNKYFDLNRKKLTIEGKIIRFLAGVSPITMHRKYLRYPENVNLFEKRLPSLNIGCLAAAAGLSSMVIEILLDINNPKIRWAPRGFHVDFNLQKAVRFYRPWGNRNILQILKIKIYHKFFHKAEYQ